MARLDQTVSIRDLKQQVTQAPPGVSPVFRFHAKLKRHLFDPNPES